jgi:hypothetical protein
MLKLLTAKIILLISKYFLLTYFEGFGKFITTDNLYYYYSLILRRYKHKIPPPFPYPYPIQYPSRKPPKKAPQPHRPQPPIPHPFHHPIPMPMPYPIPAQIGCHKPQPMPCATAHVQHSHHHHTRRIRNSGGTGVSGSKAQRGAAVGEWGGLPLRPTLVELFFDIGLVDYFFLNGGYWVWKLGGVGVLVELGGWYGVLFWRNIWSCGLLWYICSPPKSIKTWKH